MTQLHGGYDYGRAGMVAIATPQANPTVEAEMRILLPPAMLPVTVRLNSNAASPQERLRAYLLNLPETAKRFDTLQPLALGFACTGSSYLVSDSEEQKALEEVEAQCGFPVITAAAAISTKLRSLGAQRIALASPYPAPLAEAARTYWERQGFNVAAVQSIAIAGDDTRAIYALGSEDARAAVDTLSSQAVDAVLLSGTGLPSLRLLAEERTGAVLLSSNQCLAERLIALSPGASVDEGWKTRLAAATKITGSEQP
ncbi:maleate cis-trans isomerase family protein [Pacificimonas sp. ICDLI1SI03]